MQKYNLKINILQKGTKTLDRGKQPILTNCFKKNNKKTLSHDMAIYEAGHDIRDKFFFSSLFV